MAFRIGQKVVCVDGSFSPSWSVVPNRPTKGLIYTIRAIQRNFYDRHGWVDSLLLEEICNQYSTWIAHNPCEWGFAAWRFRPVVSKSTEAGMSMLRSLLKPEREKV